MDFEGVIIEESLKDKKVLEDVEIKSTKVEKVTPEHKTPWLSQWTLHNVIIPKGKAGEVAEEISKSLDYSQGTSWYADFKNDTTHYIIFKNKFLELIDLKKKNMKQQQHMEFL